ncbi:MAG: hypothetical protein HC933_00565 [Pleurocapsa sp. SU_196_0]|nr:hypothetical protein [Pleurocapsa sp. SU_196_0]
MNLEPIDRIPDEGEVLEGWHMGYQWQTFFNPNNGIIEQRIRVTVAHPERQRVLVAAPKWFYTDYPSGAMTRRVTPQFLRFSELSPSPRQLIEKHLLACDELVRFITEFGCLEAR